jgi:hypothetical protein
LLVGSGTWDDSTLDTKTSGVSTGITSLWGWLVWTRKYCDGMAAYHDCDLAMGGNERGCCKSKDEKLGEHVAD